MSIKLFQRGKIWYLRGTFAGSCVYETTGTAEAGQAEEYREKRQAELWNRRIYGEEATVTFEEATLNYIETKQPSDAERMYIRRLVDHFGAARLQDIDQGAVDLAYKAILKADAAPATRARGVLSPLTAILNHAAKRKWCSRPGFDNPKLPRSKTRWLTPLEYLEFEAQAATHLRPLLRFLICTGARLSEALELDWSKVDLGDARVSFWETKNERPRHASLPPLAIATLGSLEHREGAVFRRGDGEPYTDRGRVEGGQIKTAFNTACRRCGFGDHVPEIGNPDRMRFKPDLSPHGLRHSWATWFYGATKDLMLLRDEGGWSTIRMVERYAHLMRSDQVADVVDVWGPTHPRIGDIIRADTVQPAARA